MHALLLRVRPFAALLSVPVLFSVSEVHGVWMVGKIDEVKLLKEEKLAGSHGQRLKAGTDVQGGRGRQAKERLRIVDHKTTEDEDKPPGDGRKRQYM